jgi:hypothetical protein
VVSRVELLLTGTACLAGITLKLAKRATVE